MTPDNLLLDDKSKFIKVLEIFPECFIDEFVNHFLFNGRYEAESKTLLHEYYQYSKKVLSEFMDEDINNTWKKFNNSFYSLYAFLKNEFHVPEYHLKTYEKPPCEYLKPAWHHNFHEDPNFNEEKLAQWNDLLEELRKLSNDFEDKYIKFVSTASRVISSNSIDSESKKPSIKDLERLDAKKKKQHSKTASFMLALDFNNNTREIRINDILISRPNFNSDNHSLFEHLFANSGKTFEKSKLKDILKIKIKPFNDFLNDIKIKKTVRKYLVSYSKDKIKLIKYIEIDNCKDIENIENELNELKQVETSGNKVK